MVTGVIGADDDVHVRAPLTAVSLTRCSRLRRTAARLCRLVMPHYPVRFVGVVLAVVANGGLLIIGVRARPSDFPSYLLAIFIANLLLYFFQYLIAKLVNRERIQMWPVLMLLAGTCTWAVSLWLFMVHVTDWSVS
jgi:hypothetical protein